MSGGLEKRTYATAALLRSSADAVLIHVLPAGMLARQPPSTFTANSATAAGVATSSHAKEKARLG